MQFVSMFSPRWLGQQTFRAGLQNLGNSCYANSILQCLAHLPPVGNLVLDPSGFHGFNQTCPFAAASLNAQQNGGEGRVEKCTACLLSLQLRLVLNAQYKILRPVRVMTHLTLFSKTFQKGRQEDSHEFFHAVIDAVERDSRKGLAELYGLKEGGKGTRTLVQDLFEGRLLSQVCESGLDCLRRIRFMSMMNS